jgi:hypothetical protein
VVNGWAIVGGAPRLSITHVEQQADGAGWNVTVLARNPAGELNTYLMMAHLVPPGEHPDRNPSYVFRERIPAGSYYVIDGAPFWKYKDGMDLYLRSEKPHFMRKKASPWAVAEIRL